MNNMNKQEQAFFEGFVKRADEYGYRVGEALELLEKVAFGSPTYLAAQQTYNNTPSSLHYSSPRGVSGHVLASASRNNSQINPPATPVSSVAPINNSAPQSAVPQNSSSNNNGLIFENPSNMSAPKRSIDSYPAVNGAPAASQDAPNNNQSFKPSQPYLSTGYNGISWPKQTAQYPQQAQPIQARPLPSAMSAPRDLDESGNPIAAGHPQPAMQPSPRTDAQALNASPQALGSAAYSQGPLDTARLRKIMGSYDPKSRLDRAKAEAIAKMYRPGMRPQEIYNDPGYQAASRRY